MSCRSKEGGASSRDRRKMIYCRSGAQCLEQLLWLAAAAAATAHVASASVNTSSRASQPPSACQQQQQQQRRPLGGGSPLQPTDLWQFADAFVSSVADSCHFTIEAPSANASRGTATTPAAGRIVVTPSYFSSSNASATPPAPQLLVLRLISWHPGTECLRETCSSNASAPPQRDGGRCAVALSLAPRSPSFVAAGDSRRSVEALLVTGGGSGTGSSSSSSASTAATIAWTDAALSAIVSGSGCCGARLLLGYKVAPARSVCSSAASESTASSTYSSSLSFSSDAPPRSDTLSTNRYSTPELVDKYTYMFAQDRKLGWLPLAAAAEAATPGAACRDGEDYVLVILPAAAAEGAFAEQEVRFDLLTAPTRRSCRRLCIADDCSPRLGAFNASGGRSLSVRYEWRWRAESGGAESGGACADHEYSGFTLRLLAPSRVQFAASVSPQVSINDTKHDWVLVIALAAGAAAFLIALTAAIGALVARWRRSRRSASPSMEMRSREINSQGKLPSMTSDDVDDNEQNRYEEVKYSEGRKRAPSRDHCAENTYWKLGMSAEGGAAGAESEDHVYEPCSK